VIGGTLDVRVTGGDPIVAEEVVATFEWFVEQEFQRDVRERAERHGDAAHQHPLARTDRQRRFDAWVTMARAARAHGDGTTPADVVVNLVADPRTMNEAFAHAELVVESEDGVETIELSDADEWYRDDGPTDQRNANIECRTHNLFKSGARWRVRRDGDGRRFHIRPDGSVVLPVGAREPDFSDDDMIRAAGDRVAALIANRDHAA
jgi:hypothetical protein